jgi:hypothetical protein
MATPSSVRFDPAVLQRLRSFVSTHPGLSTSGAANQLVDEALRSREHSLVIFRDGPMGRRARLAGGPDVWEVVQAIRSAQRSEPDLSAEQIMELVSDTSGLPTGMVRAAVAYWADYPDEIDALLDLADASAEQAKTRWRRERELLSG